MTERVAANDMVEVRRDMLGVAVRKLIRHGDPNEQADVDALNHLWPIFSPPPTDEELSARPRGCMERALWPEMP